MFKANMKTTPFIRPNLVDFFFYSFIFAILDGCTLWILWPNFVVFNENRKKQAIEVKIQIPSNKETALLCVEWLESDFEIRQKWKKHISCQIDARMATDKVTNKSIHQNMSRFFLTRSLAISLFALWPLLIGSRTFMEKTEKNKRKEKSTLFTGLRRLYIFGIIFKEINKLI